VKALAAVAPHAGYIYSGGVAGRVFASVEVPRRCVVLCPNHTGMGANAAVWTKGSWEIPTGKIPVDNELAEKILKLSSDLRDDPTAHMAEHSLEVELPFMLERQPELTIVPIAISRVNMEGIRGIGKAISEAIKATEDDVLIVASTDMNHYESDQATKKKDELAIEKVLALDPDGLVTTCASERISMCGVLPTAIAIIASKALGAREAHLVAHATSGDISGDRDAVVGYAGFIIK
jgi:AmmeMemoRadiSam system protein B